MNPEKLKVNLYYATHPIMVVSINNHHPAIMVCIWIKHSLICPFVISYLGSEAAGARWYLCFELVSHPGNIQVYWWFWRHWKGVILSYYQKTKLKIMFLEQNHYSCKLAIMKIFLFSLNFTYIISGLIIVTCC